jgi:uncharacterized protein (TIGR00661 family)
LNQKKNILICPLEWGLGHAGRMVPVARRLKELDHNIFFGSGEELLSFFRKEVPGATYICFPGFRIRYSTILPQYILILFYVPAMLYHIFSEHKRLKKLISDYSIDIVISDSRIGLWNDGIKSVFVTHQLRIRFPEPFRMLEFFGENIMRSVISKYSLCFVPDLDGELNVSGELSHGIRLTRNVRYIGILSRFEGSSSGITSYSGKSLVVLSGPEPQRSKLKQKLTDIFLHNEKPVVILEGKPAENEKSSSLKNIEYINHPSGDGAFKLLKESELIITRAGYTTIMELISLGRSALLIPTFGQTEQEYLAEYLSQKGWFSSVSQKDLNHNLDLSSVNKKMPPMITERSRRLLDSALNEMLK